MTEMSTLPPVNELYTGSPDPLIHALTILFETSPSIASTLAAQSTPASSYAELIDFALAVIAQWDDDRKAAFISGHPRIGEVKNLSQLSAKEQAAVATPPEVLARLHHLNACYERRYPGLRYITFVNGRSRAAIMEEMEDKLGFARTLSPSEPPVESLEEIDPRSEEWKAELERAVQDVGKIAKSRLKTLGVE